MSNGDAPLFEAYKDKSNSLQRTTIIFLGISFFFFFMILIPYFSLKADNSRLSSIYGKLNETSDDIQYAASALMDQYKKNILQSINLTQAVDAYGKQLQNLSKSDDDLKKITYRTCDSHVMRSSTWIICNSNIQIEGLQKTLNASINLNNTVIKRIQDAISRQIELTDLSSGFLDINKVGHVKAILQNLTSVKSAQILYGLQPTVNNLTQGVNSQIGNLLTQMNTLSDKFKSLDTPLGGSIPVSFNVLLAVFPLALSIVFCYLAMTLRDTIRLRRVLETGTNQNAKDFVSESPLWIDPKPPKNSINDYKLHTLAAWIVLAVPALLFVGSLIIISSIWFWLPITADKFPPFAAASEFNELIYRILYVLSGILFGFSYAMIIKK